MKGTGKEIPMRCRESGKSLLPLLAVFASVLLAQSALAVTYKASLPIEPVHPRYAYCGSFDVGLRNVLFDAGDIEDDEHDVVEVENNLHWAVRDAGGTVVAEMDAEVATVSSSLPGGSGFIYSPGEYTMTFTGYVKYNVIVHDEDGGSTTEGPFTVPLTASGGGRLTMPFAFVGVGSLSCGGVTSTTATPGANETLVVPVGHNLKSNIDGNSSLLVASASSQQWRLHNPAERSAFLNISNLFVEGIENGSETLTVDITANDGRVILSDVVNYSLIAADCYSQPTVAEKTIYTADNRFPSLRSAGCEWSISPNSATIAYNCIAWSIGVNTRKFTPADFGCPNNEVLPTEEQVDDFYSDHGYERTSIDQATVFYYSGFHASKRINCSCGNDKWTMLSSKCGSGHIVEHRKEHLTEFYGTILYGYKKTQE